ncbi:diguanylate cyclase domain-containing protein [Desulfurella sp.]|uniref:TackOD1 domain-containing metal-binding protein n=1 Tax=Desulfurella sp. TaxID=1962857 RepID=UPI003D0CAF65
MVLQKKLIIFSNRFFEKRETYEVFNSWESFLDSAIEPIGFWIAKDFNDNYLSIINNIRRSNWWYKYCFSEDNLNNKLLDGSLDIDQAIDKCNLSEEKIAKLKFSLGGLAPSEKLLVYLYLREGLEIVPQFNPNAPKLYTYPIIEILSDNQNDLDWYQELIRKNLIAYKKLIDRVRLCNKCSSAHIYFIDICPNCKNIDIKRSRFLHCFTCGYVGKQEEFSKGYDLICPKCNAHLKHIGVDYDLPTAQYICNNCGYVFEEPETIYRCIACGEEGSPDKLNIQEFYSIEMTLYGREWLLLEQKKMIFSVLNESLKYVSLEYFQLLLDWFIKLYRRDSNFSFALALIKFQNIEEIIQFYGISQSIEIYRALAQRISEMLRNTDIVCRDDEYKLWIFLPATKKKGICNRINKLVNSIQPESGVKIKVYINIQYSSEIDSEINAEFLMNKLDKTDD